ncbi:MAG: FtsX-like permease family protein [Actinomycetota bacterium]|nr:FtsX-like permease family protein [Actinomycetota bacterium]
MLLVGLLALLIAGIGTLNAMQSMLARRRLEIAMLKALGFGQGTMFALFGGEAAAVGLAGGIFGSVVGAGVSKLVTDAIARAEALQVVFVLDAGTLAAGVLLGIGATLVFAVLPIVRAAAFRPLELLREGATASSGSGALRSSLLLALILLLFAALASVILGDMVLATEMTAGAFIVCGLLTGGFVLLFGWIGRLGRPANRPAAVIVASLLLAFTAVAANSVPAIAPILALATLLCSATIALPSAWMLPLLIAARSLSRRRARNSVTLVAFLAGVLSMTLTLTVALSLRNQINTVLASTGSVNLVALSNPGDERAILRASATLPGVKSMHLMTVIATKPTAVNGRPLASVIGPAPDGRPSGWEDERGRLLGGMTGFDLAHGDHPLGVEVPVGRPLGPSDVGTDHVLLRTRLLGFPYFLHSGDRVTIQESGSGLSRTVQVVGFYYRPRRTRGFGSFFTPPIYADRSLALALGRDDAQNVLSYAVDPDQLAHNATALQRAVPGALVINVGDLIAVVETILNELLNLLGVITMLVLGAGLAVVANGVALAMLERRREIALFKAIGFGPGNVLRFVLVENAFLGTLAGAVSVVATAIALEILSRYALQHAIGFDPMVAVIVLVVAAALAAITACVTAWRPVRIRPIEALRNE